MGGGIARGFLVAVLVLASSSSAAQKRFWLDAKQKKAFRERSDIAQVAREAAPSVVAITTEQEPSSEEPAEPHGEPQRGLGAGFIISPDGYILTSQHVIEGAAKIRIKLNSPDLRAEYDATVVGQDLATDVALLKINVPRKLRALKLGSADNVDVADWVVAIGNPFGLAHSVSVGVISFKGRTEINPNGREGYFDFIQTDAAINPGNSGGPILDLDGEVVAIANAVNVSGQGIAFALPIDMAKEVLPALRSHGRVRRGWMGVSVQDLTREVLESYQLRGNTHGVVVSEVLPSSPGDRAGVRVGDVITAINQQGVERAHTLRWAVATAGVRGRVTLRLLRDGRPLTLIVQLAELPSPDDPDEEESVVVTPSPSPRAPEATPSVGDD